MRRSRLTRSALTPIPPTPPFQGGPGCSSLEGAFAELGQLLVNPAAPSQLMLNPYAWSTISNMLYIEAPACVGYSYGDVISDCSHNDSSQAQDNLAAVQAFFAGFPEYRNNVRLGRACCAPCSAASSARSPLTRAPPPQPAAAGLLHHG